MGASVRVGVEAVVAANVGIAAVILILCDLRTLTGDNWNDDIDSNGWALQGV
jgi:hypothetical protein